MSVDFFASSLSSFRTFLRLAITSYEGSKPSSTSTPSLLLGRSRTCPMDAMIWNELPRNPARVRVLAGDSTMSKSLGITALSLGRQVLHPHRTPQAERYDYRCRR